MSTHPSPLVGALWRVVARHDHIEPTVRALAHLLGESVPFGWLLVRRWDPLRARLESVAGVRLPAEVDPWAPVPSPRAELLLGWAARREPHAFAERAASGIARLCVPEGLEGPVVIAPLHGEVALLGVLVLGGAARPPREALEPFAVALENDARQHELLRLREAAESDRSALLTRLARADVSDAIVGAERGLADVMSRVDQVAPTEAPVLILGETGSGKEVVARAIHHRSRRTEGPFLRVNCGAIPAELVDSELFGHEKGSFTGAITQRKGWFERADGGTLFLDEVGELPAAAQVRLLRVLQDGTFERVGGQETHRVDVRIVAATHRDVAGMVRAGTFRQDLWYRVSVFPIHLPPLRERQADIPALAAWFAERAGLRLYGRPLEIEPADLAVLRAYPWPGNVRELMAVVERAAILGAGRALPIAPALGVGVQAAPLPAEDDRGSIEAALRRSQGRIEGPFGAAAVLGCNPHTLRSRMRRLGIDWSTFRRRGCSAETA